MAFWICDKHKTAGKITKRDDWRRLFASYDNPTFENCDIRIVSDDNALALGWKGMD